jgi:hypothetical protein
MVGNKAMQETKKEKLDRIWQEIFRLQHEACIAPLCLLDQLQFNDLKQQMEELTKE